jgi:hypothetical protein
MCDEEAVEWEAGEQRSYSLGVLVLHDDSNQTLSCLCFAIGSGDDRLGFAVRQRLDDVGSMIVLGR